ncbi:unnamed protein product [Lampetra fluviatilis]
MNLTWSECLLGRFVCVCHLQCAPAHRPLFTNPPTAGLSSRGQHGLSVAVSTAVKDYEPGICQASRCPLQQARVVDETQGQRSGWRDNTIGDSHPPASPRTRGALPRSPSLEEELLPSQRCTNNPPPRHHHHHGRAPLNNPRVRLAESVRGSSGRQRLAVQCSACGVIDWDASARARRTRARADAAHARVPVRAPPQSRFGG